MFALWSVVQDYSLRQAEMGLKVWSIAQKPGLMLVGAVTVLCLVTCHLKCQRSSSVSFLSFSRAEEENEDNSY